MPFLELHFENIKVVRKGLENLSKKIPEVARQRLWYFVVSIRKEMKVPGARPTYPIQWDSERQRKAFFATKGTFIRGYDGPSKIPTRRTGNYVRAWKATKIEGGYEVSNPLAHAKFIGGMSGGSKPQSKIHQGRWNVFFFVIQRKIRKLPLEVRTKINQVIRQEGFKTK